MDRPKDIARVFYKLALCIYAITIGVAKAEQQPVTNIAGPSASSTGSVTNQAVQVLNGPYMTNTFGAGVSCQGMSLNVTPFGYSTLNGSSEPKSFQSHNINSGVAATLTIPLSGSLQELCKARAQAEINRQQAETAKAKLDFELVRLLKCGEAKKAGIFFHPESPYAAICADIVLGTPIERNAPTISSPASLKK
jgi:hypothetical protein